MRYSRPADSTLYCRTARTSADSVLCAGIASTSDSENGLRADAAKAAGRVASSMRAQKTSALTGIASLKGRPSVIHATQTGPPSNRVRLGFFSIEPVLD